MDLNQITRDYVARIRATIAKRNEVAHEATDPTVRVDIERLNAEDEGTSPRWFA